MKTEQPTTPAAVGEGRDIALDHASAKAIADASAKAGFPVPPTAAAVLRTKPIAKPKAPAKPKAKPKTPSAATAPVVASPSASAAGDTVNKED